MSCVTKSRALEDERNDAEEIWVRNTSIVLILFATA